ncbi:MAG: SPOR domain-containing protein [Alphaproteobacteria bacterium]
MNNNDFQNYNYDQFTSSPQAPQRNRRQDGFVGGILKSPIFATGALLLVGAAFASVIMMGYSGSKDEANIPVVEAQETAFKDVPAEAGGMNVPFQDSTVFESLAGAEIKETAPIENLLSSEDEVARMEAFAAEAERLIQESEAARKAAEIRSIETAALIEEATGVAPPRAASSAVQDRVNDAVNAPSENLLQKIEPARRAGDLYEIASAAPEVVTPKITAKAPVTPVVKPSVPVKAEEPAAPVQIARVESSAAAQAAAIAPAAGFAITAGSHYVQLGSVKSQAGASSEWGKFKKKYAAELSDAKYRVQRADLGERGVFYRIQAGPMSASSAKEVCGSIKAVTPGGCLVVK